MNLSKKKTKTKNKQKELFTRNSVHLNLKQIVTK